MHTSSFKDLIILTRFPVSLAVTYSAFAAMVLATGTISYPMIWPTLGIFLLASGASAYNQYQEWPYDERMDRTRQRPIPSRRISPAEGIRIAMIAIAGGLVVMIYETNLYCFLLGLANLIWYNGLYTWLKRRTAFAVVPGALTGVIPVFMGWSSMNDDFLSPPSLLYAFFIFIWQMPHFWMLMLIYGDDYRKAGFLVLNDLFTDFQIKVIVMIWIIASSAASLFFIYFRMVQHPVLGYSLMASNCIFLILAFFRFFIAKTGSFRLLFITANILMFLVITFLVVDKFII